MPSPLKFKKSDPNSSGRGRGWYYKRNAYKSGWMSKYSAGRDAGKRIKAKAQPKLKPRLDHTGDKNKRKMTYHRRKVSPKGMSRVRKGWF